MPPIFSYTQQPPRAQSGMIADYNQPDVRSFVLSDSTGTSSGKAMFRVAAGFPSNGNKLGRRTTGGTELAGLMGFVVYNPGKPGDPAVDEYVTTEVVPVCVAGRQWVHCENFAVDPATADDSWYVRTLDGAAAIGNLRYGNNDGGDCVSILPGLIRVFEAFALAGGAALVLIDFDLRRHMVEIPAIPPAMVWQGAYNALTAYNLNDVVAETGGGADGTYVNIHGAGSTTGMLPSTTPARWQLVALAP